MKLNHILFQLVVGSAVSLQLAALAAGSDIDPRGPVTTPGMQVEVTSEGVQARSYKFTNHCQKPAPWQAQWIWLSQPAPSKTEMVEFRKEIMLAEIPSMVSVWLSADVFYRLYINGVLASRGPADIGRDYDRAKPARH